MSIKIEVIRTLEGEIYRNEESKQIVGFVREGNNKPDIFFWKAYENFWGFNTKEKSHRDLQKVLSDNAKHLGSTIEFIHINNI